jgi:peptide/nickel transport system substrate-binding protein
MRQAIGSALQYPLLLATFGALVCACAPQRAGEAGSAFVRQEAISASIGGGNFEVDGQAALRTPGEQITDKTLVIGIASEVRGFSPMNGFQNKYVEDLVQGNLFLQDEQGRWFPAIAAEHPRLENGTWRLFDDGSSETIYRIKRGVKWYDGVEFTVHDLVFFWNVAVDHDVPYAARERAQRIRSMEALDDYTLKTTWNIWEAEADTIDLRLMFPMPRHILEESFNSDKLRFINHPYWTTDFVGLGPYKLTRLEHGSHMELVANDDYVLGRPRIKNVVVRFYLDSKVLISALLSGDVHLTLHGNTGEGGLSMADGILLGTRWSGSGEGKVIFNPYQIAILAVQSYPEFQRPAALGDVRVRQALLHAIDRQTLVEQRFGGFTSVAEVWVPPEDPDYVIIAQGAPRYPFDPDRAQRLFAETGWQKGPDGLLSGPGGARFELEYRAIGSEAEANASAVADYWKRIGIDTQLTFGPRARTSDHEWMAKFPGIRNHTMVSSPVGGATGRYSCGRAPWRTSWLNQSSNPAGYCSEEAEKWYQAVETGFPFDAKITPFRELMLVALRDLPYLPLYYESEVAAVRSNVEGINRVPPKNRGRLAMSAFTWTIK